MTMKPVESRADEPRREAPVVTARPRWLKSCVSSASDGEVKDYVLSVVSEKTGYPVEMLDLDLDLEADLGVDTVKQAELFATIRTHYGIPRKEDLRLSEYNTLMKVISFVTSNQAGECGTRKEPNASRGYNRVHKPSVVETQEVQPVDAQVADGADDSIKAYVLSAVSEKTGYPAEMLDMELDLEADLGIDTVKQAELFATIRTHYGIPRREDLRLSDYNTLQKVVSFVREGLVAQQAAQAPAKEMPAVPATDAPEVEETPAVQIRRRVPVPVLRPRLDLCQPTGVTLDKQSRVLVIASPSKLTDSLVKQLTKLQVAVRTCAPSEVLTSMDTFEKEQPVDGIFFLSDDTDDRAAKGSAADGIEPLFHAVKTLPSLKFLIAATQMGGFFGFAGECDHPLDGLVSGFVKAMASERPQLFAKVVDLDHKSSPKVHAERLIGETLFDPGMIEIGMDGQLRFGISLKEVDYDGTPDPFERGQHFCDQRRDCWYCCTHRDGSGEGNPGYLPLAGSDTLA